MRLGRSQSRRTANIGSLRLHLALRGRTGLDPDQRLQEVIRLIFARFRARQCAPGIAVNDC
jgi:hypothetical protein